MTLNKIKEFMTSQLPLSNLSDYSYNSGRYYDEDGHCSSTLYSKIVNFWKNFDSENDFIYLVSGEYATELDLTGGRSYLLLEEDLAPMCFEYLINNLGFTQEKFDDCIYNTTELNELIDDLFTDKSSIRDVKIKEILKEE